MRGRLALAAAAGVALAAGMPGLAAQSPHAASNSTARPTARHADGGAAQPTAQIRRLQQAVSAEEARRQETQRRLQRQDQEIQRLRSQLQTASGHDSVRPR